ncbi:MULTISPECIES: hypothetical protein [unclassified Kitasatospora]|uniref:hypothetical protein n=1 Tax=unclassified Kitasatospora TaxID=2633591 RepID=UPI0033FCE28C
MITLVGLALALGGGWFALTGMVRREAPYMLGGVTLLAVGAVMALGWADSLIRTVADPFL